MVTRRLAVFLVLLTCAPLARAADKPAPRPAATYLLLEGERFTFPGGWAVVGDPDCLSRQYLVGSPAGPRQPVHDAMTVVRVDRAATYRVWTRSRDYATNQTGARRYRVTIDGQPVEHESGRHGKEGWAWELVGRLDLAAGPHMVGLRHVNTIPRCDAVLITDSDADPATITFLLRHRPAPRPTDWEVIADPAARPPTASADAPAQARLENDRLRAEFVTGRGGEPMLRLAVKAGDAWRPIGPASSTRLDLVAAADNPGPPKFTDCYPTWPGQSRPFTVRVAGKDYAVHEPRDPFRAGRAIPLKATAATQVDATTVELRYAPNDDVVATARFTLAPGRADLACAATLTPKRDGGYGLAFSAGTEAERPSAATSKLDPTQPDVRFCLLPPLYQYQRLPNGPCVVPDAMMPHPLALVEYKGDAPVTCAVIADPDQLPFRWPAGASRFGFSLLNARGRVQPTIFSPILGLENSAWTAGQPRTFAWRVLVLAGDWRAALAYVSDTVMTVRDYRKPIVGSMATAATNMIALMKDAVASGWDARQKGFYNIEMEATVTHASPLGILEAAVLAHDEDFFATRALPTIEFTLTRSGAHDTRPDKATGPQKLTVPGQFFGTAYWQGVDQLLGSGLNPWIAELALGPNGQPRHFRAYNTIPDWSEYLAAWRLKREPALLAEARKRADAWLASDLFGRKDVPVSFEAFYNISFYPYWWDLADLYEATGDTKYRDASREGAFHTIAGLWSWPRVPAGEVTVNAGGQYTGTATIWWKGDQRYRLGAPRKPGDTPERTAPAWEVATVGLGLEQPSTYFVRSQFMRHIMMSSWAPNLLRAAADTGEDLFRTYARNSAIGRFSNYPGYYLMGYTDLPLAPDYVYKGPDVSSIYYHHIPVHFGWTVDFLVAQAQDRSGGKIRFPYARQQGYAWFSNRVYGGAPGTVFGHAGARLTLDPSVKLGTIEVDHLIARTPEHLWLILMSQSDKDLDVRPALDGQKLGLAPAGEVLVYRGAGGVAERLPAGGWKTVRVPAKGLVAVAIPVAARAAEAAIPPVPNGHQVKDLGALGQVHAFRLRTPFRKDAVYVALANGAKGAAMTVTVAGEAKPRAAEAFPQEVSVWPVALESDVKLAVTVTAGGQSGEAGFEFKAR